MRHLAVGAGVAVIGAFASAIAAVLVVRQLRRLLRDRSLAGPRLEAAHSWPGSRRGRHKLPEPAPAGTLALAALSWKVQAKLAVTVRGTLIPTVCGFPPPVNAPEKPVKA